jgi:hypothetical protein
MTIETSTLRPGLLVNLKTSIVGNVKYVTRDIDKATTTTTGALKAKWETERTISDPVEHETAMKVRSKVRALITTVCSASAFGLLCPEAAADDLASAIAEARKLADEFNQTAKISRLRVYVLTGRIAQNDVEAVRAINSEVSELLQDMERGVENTDVKAIREAANKARGIAEMLNTEARIQAEIAIDAARRAARAIKQDGAAAKVDKRAMRTIADARTAFLDFDEQRDVAAPKVTGRAVELAE